MAVNVKLLAGQMVYLFLLFALPLFLAAGTIAWLAGWVYLILFMGFTFAITLWLYRNNPSLLKERMTGNSDSRQKPWDKALISLMFVLFVAWLILMPLDAVRYQWTYIPAWLQIVGAIALLCSFYLFYLTFRENSFLSPVVRVQEDRGQTVVTTGPYHYVRHPMYAAALLFMLGTPLLLGSWYGVLMGCVLITLMGRRAVMEEHTLREELQGYNAYTTQVKYRFIPYVW